MWSFLGYGSNNTDGFLQIFSKIMSSWTGDIDMYIIIIIIIVIEMCEKSVKKNTDGKNQSKFFVSNIQK